MPDSDSTNKWALVFLRDKTRLAYRNGEIGTVRHLCVLALEKIDQEQSVNNKQKTDLHDWIWAFVFMLFNLKGDSEYRMLERTYESFGSITEEIFPGGMTVPRHNRPDAEVSPYAVIINFIFDVYDPNRAKRSIENHYNKLLNLDMNNLYEVNDGPLQLEDELLLTMVIELFWYMQITDNRWQELANKWIAETDSHISQALSQTKERLQVQYLIVRGFNQGTDIIDLIKSTFTGPNQESFQLLALAWYYFYVQDWDNIELLISKLVRIVSFDSEYFLAVQGFINMTGRQRYMHNMLAKGSKESFDELAGYMRYQRACLSRPGAIVNLERELSFELMVYKAKNQPFTAGSDRAHMWYLSILLELDAFRLWDLGAYLKAMECRKQYSAQLGLYFLEDGQYWGETDQLKEILYWAVKSLNVKPDKDKELNDAQHLLETKAGSSIPGLVRELIYTKPVEWPYTVEIFKLLGDSIPEDMLDELANWSQRFVNKGFSGTLYNPSRNLQFWEPIIKYNKLTDEMWKQILPVFYDLLIKPGFWHDHIILLITVLTKAPLRHAKIWADIIANTKFQQIENEVERILFNAAIERSELKPIAIEYLQSIQSDKATYALQLLRTTTEMTEVDSKGYCEVLLKELRSYCDNIQNTLDGNMSLGVGLASEFKRCNWYSITIGELKDILILVNDTINNSKNIGIDEISDLMNTLLYISYSAQSDYCDSLIKLVDNWVINPPQGHSFIHNGGPLSNFHFSTNIYNPVDYSLILLVTQLYKNANPEIADRFIKWALDRCIYTEEINLSYLSRFFFIVFLVEDAKEQAITGLNSILARVINSSGTVYFIQGLTSIIEDQAVKDDFSGIELIKSLDEDSFSYVEKLIINVIKYGVNADPDTRRHAAICIDTWKEQFGINDHLQEIEKAFKNDLRARVRNVFNADL